VPDSEKLSFNINIVDLGEMDLLVDQGFYSSRTDFIRTAIRNQLNTHMDTVKQTITRKAMALGVVGYSRKDLEARRKTGEQLDVKVVGMLVIEPDVSAELARATLASLEVHGSFRASDAVKEALADRMK
jgi:Arc/MetJ-type ribon-helix-helix transcriptional regulator